MTDLASFLGTIFAYLTITDFQPFGIGKIDDKQVFEMRICCIKIGTV
jgi:hypothetical protein